MTTFLFLPGDSFGGVYGVFGSNPITRVFVSAGVTLRATGSEVLQLGKDGIDVVVAGTTVSNVGTSVLFDQSIGSTLVVGPTGTLAGLLTLSAGVRFFDSPGAFVANSGMIYGATDGVNINASSPSGSSTIVNSGVIACDEGAGILKLGSEALLVRNAGIIEGGSYSFRETSGDAVSRIVNTGTMVGAIDLGGGDDLYDGRFGAVVGAVLGLAGADRLLGGDGDERLDGGLGIDTLAGGDGDDTYIVGEAGDVVAERPGAGNDVIAASVSINLTTRPNIENVALLGSANIFAIGSEGANTLSGNAGSNGLTGLGGNDVLVGGGGGDTLVPGLGTDLLFGQAGNDSFVFNSTADSAPSLAFADRIADFALGDRIVLTNIDANTGAAFDQAFTLDLGATFGVGEIRQIVSGGTLALLLNTDADGAAEMVIALNRTTTLVSADFAF